MVCLRNICVNTLHKGDSIFTNKNNIWLSMFVDRQRLLLLLLFTERNCFYAYKECHKTGSLENHTTTGHKEEDQLDDLTNVGESSCNPGDGTDQRVESFMFMMMIHVRN
jgi:hypothetical protein